MRCIDCIEEAEVVYKGDSLCGYHYNLITDYQKEKEGTMNLFKSLNICTNDE